MSIILREHEYAENAIKTNSMGAKPCDTLRIVSRYYIDKGYKSKEVKKLMDEFVIRCDPCVSLVKWDKRINDAIKYAEKHKAINVDYISITKSEIKIIDGLNRKPLKRLAFTLLCIAKFWMSVNETCNWWIKDTNNDIMKMANINTSIKRQSEMYSYLREIGLIEFSKRVDNTSVRVCFHSDDEEAMRISDFRNLGYQYLMYHGEPYFECESCGIVTKVNNVSSKKPQRYCTKCATEIKIKQRVNSVMKQRKCDF